MDKTPIRIFIEEIKRQEFTPQNNDTTPLSNFKYNGILYNQGSNTYHKVLDKFFCNFKDYIISQNQILVNVTLKELEEVMAEYSFYTKTPSQEEITGLKNELARQRGRNIALKVDIDKAVFLSEMFSEQLYFLEKSIAYIKELNSSEKPKQSEVNEEVKDIATKDTKNRTERIDGLKFTNNKQQDMAKSSKACDFNNSADDNILIGEIGLRKFLGVGKQKATEIMRSGALKYPIDYYRVGKEYRFYKDRLGVLLRDANSQLNKELSQLKVK